MESWMCPKCGNQSFDKDQFQATGGNFAKIFDMLGSKDWYNTGFFIERNEKFFEFFYNKKNKPVFVKAIRSKRAEVQRFIYGKKKYSSYGSFIWKNLLADSLIQKTDGSFYDRPNDHVVYYITPRGEAFLEEINQNNIYKNK